MGLRLNKRPRAMPSAGLKKAAKRLQGACWLQTPRAPVSACPAAWRTGRGELAGLRRAAIIAPSYLMGEADSDFPSLDRYLPAGHGAACANRWKQDKLDGQLLIVGPGLLRAKPGWLGIRAGSTAEHSAGGGRQGDGTRAPQWGHSMDCQRGAYPKFISTATLNRGGRLF